MTQKGYSAYRYESYKEALKARLLHLRAARPGLTARKLADRLSIQPTYLSRCLNDDRSHLSEDHLYVLGQLLELTHDEIEYLMLLRSYATTQEPARKDALFRRIDSMKAKRVGGTHHADWNPESFQNEVAYLFSPLCIVTHAALFIKDYQKNPRLLCPLLGVSAAKLKEILRILDASDYIEISEKDPFTIKEVKAKRPHFNREHPLMRAHQATLKTLLQSRLNQTSEEEKESFLATFTMDDAGFEKVREAFKEFIGKVQQISGSGEHTNVYQLSFDFLKWL